MWMELHSFRRLGRGQELAVSSRCSGVRARASGGSRWGGDAPDGARPTRRNWVAPRPGLGRVGHGRRDGAMRS
jgi:hypothetical protein